MPVIPNILKTKYRTAKNNVIIQLFTGKYNTTMIFLMKMATALREFNITF